MNWESTRSLTPSPTRSSTAAQPKTQPGASFRDVLSAAAKSATNGWNVSQHAQQRLSQRGIQLSASDLDAMERAAKQAEQKGATNAYMVLGPSGFVVNLPSRTVVTAMENASNPIVTQIDSVVFVNRLDPNTGGFSIGDRPIR
ncbi:hypothetical protein [Alicyclobacillus acidiphilus]|uniref:hypothetical protein n=1 Tax=Alicyclobacillus acidiphilus TaxID=182455 RepID=UPI001FE08219|nr:hypothetical protein [Alicyclobacillus acidiphilus]